MFSPSPIQSECLFGCVCDKNKSGQFPLVAIALAAETADFSFAYQKQWRSPQVTVTELSYEAVKKQVEVVHIPSSDRCGIYHLRSNWSRASQ